MDDVAEGRPSGAHDPLCEALKCLQAGSLVVLATVIETWGSSPVPVGGQMVIADEGRFWGAVSGGCVETEVIVRALEVIEDGVLRVLSFGVQHETAWDAGLPCGGEIRILLERLDGEEGLAFVQRLVGAKAGRLSVIVKTRLSDGAREIASDTAQMAKADRETMRSGVSRVVAGESCEVFHHAIVPGPRILIVGATQISRSLVQMCSMVSFDAIVIDPREAYASETRFSGVARKVGWPEDVLADLAVDEQTAVVALSHVAEIDDQALVFALRSPCRYVGALGSVRNHARRTKRLEEKGFSADEIARVHCPVGLDIGARQPEEIALSVMAELVLAFRGKRRS